jgi:uncharacterized protein (TIGR00725 family)
MLDNVEVTLISDSWLNILAHRKLEIKLAQELNPHMRFIAVFGGATIVPGSTGWRKVFNLGMELAQRNAAVINGGYSGVMEASAAGARSVGGVTVGVTCDNLPEKNANQHIQYEWRVKRWDQRLLTLVWLSDGYAVMPGSSGTLVELSMVVETQLKGFIPARPIVCLGSYWKPVVSRIEGADGMVRFARTPKECVEMLLN